MRKRIEFGLALSVTLIGFFYLGAEGSNTAEISETTEQSLSRVMLTSKNHVNLFGANSKSDWLETLIPFSSQDGAFSVLSPRGAGGIVAGTRTSDNSSSGAQGSIPILAFALNDNAKFPQTVYGVYSEARRYRGTGTSQASEFDVINGGETFRVNPYHLVEGLSAGGWFSCGRGDALSVPCSVGLGIVNNGVNPRSFVDHKTDAFVPEKQSSPFITGILFGCNSIDGIVYPSYPCGGTPRGTGTAIQLSSGQKLEWVSADGGPSASIFFSSRAEESASSSQSIKFGLGSTEISGITVIAGGKAGNLNGGFPVLSDRLGLAVAANYQVGSGETDFINLFQGEPSGSQFSFYTDRRKRLLDLTGAENISEVTFSSKAAERHATTSKNVSFHYDLSMFHVDAIAEKVNIEAQLPPCNKGSEGLLYTIKKMDGSVHLVTLKTDGRDRIDGQGAVVLTKKYQHAGVICSDMPGQWDALAN